MTIPIFSLRRLVLCTLLLLLIGGQAVILPPAAHAATEEVTNAALATVLILALDRNDDILSRGSGALISPTGLVLTNYHVVEENRRRDGRVLILVPQRSTVSRTQDFTFYWGSILTEASNPTADLALVQIDLTKDEAPLPANLTFPFLPLGDSDQVSIDGEIHILGYPSIGGYSLITLPGRIIGVNEEEDGLPWLLTDATIASGNSGGAAINADGELIGIPTITVNDERSGNTIGYLRPINLAKALIPAGGTNPDRIFCADKFTSNKQGWLLGADDGNLLTSETVIAEGTYKKAVSFKQAAYTWGNAPDCEVTDFRLEVDVTALHASDTETGIVLILRKQAQGDDDTYYRVIFYLDNSYAIDLYTDGEWQELAERTPTDQLTLDTGATHRLGVLAVGTQLTVYVNGKVLTTVFDATLASGGIGLGLIGDAGTEISVAFDNFQVGDHQPEGVLFYDFFVDNHNEWELGRLNNADVDCEDQIVNGRLEHRLTVKTEANVCYSSTPTLMAQDFWLQIDAIWLQRYVEGSWLEVAFRHDEETGHQYNLRLTQDGYYFLEKYAQEEWQTLQDWTKSIAIKRDKGATNTIKLWVHGPYITVTINDIELTTIEDDQVFAAGQIMPGVGGDTGVSTAVAFDTLIVREAPPTAN